MKDKVELDVSYPHPPARVWQALTDPAALAKWLLPSDFKPLIGFRFRLDRAGGDPIKGKVLEVEEGKLLAYTWDDGESPEPSVVCWSLDPVEGGTRVRLEHRYVETPEVTCIPMDAHFNWSYALRHSLPGLLALLAGGGAVLPRPPIFYRMATPGEAPGRLDAGETPALPGRIGFRQEVTA